MLLWMMRIWLKNASEAGAGSVPALPFSVPSLFLSLQIMTGTDVKKAPFGACFSSSPALDQPAGLDGSL